MWLARRCLTILAEKASQAQVVLSERIQAAREEEEAFKRAEMTCQAAQFSTISPTALQEIKKGRLAAKKNASSYKQRARALLSDTGEASLSQTAKMAQEDEMTLDKVQSWAVKREEALRAALKKIGDHLGATQQRLAAIGGE
jgi:hypothetical protein